MNRQLLTVARPVRRAQRRLFDRCCYLLSLLRPYQPLLGGKQHWDAEYAQGVWSYLKDLDELPHFSVVAGYCHHFAPGGAILEIGCGAGTLQERLCPGHYSRYVGVDVSSEAITRAAAVKRSSAVEFVEADAIAFVPQDTFDLILFNECLYYFSDPVSLVRRYEHFLEIQGYFVVSMFESQDDSRTKKIWKALALANYTTPTSSIVINQHGSSWLIKVLRPRGG
jgi:SAM-dependent methyltransferase